MNPPAVMTPATLLEDEPTAVMTPATLLEDERGSMAPLPRKQSIGAHPIITLNTQPPDTRCAPTDTAS